jgi:aryl-alcohol dehydrogenase-like predicted oxidoreductase
MSTPIKLATSSRPPLSSILPPLIFGTGTFNVQYHKDPYSLNTTQLVQHALSHGIRAFDTSPYYGPSETLLGEALIHPSIKPHFPRQQYYLLTKAGRLTANSFDYSPNWIRQSVARSLQRLHTTYLDLVYCHDVEYVSAAEVVTAVRELRRLRDEEGTIRYVGISGYPLSTLCELAERILRETGEAVDAVQSYANMTLQNTRLVDEGVERLRAAGVDVVPSASILGHGLLRADGLPESTLAWHPAPVGLREAVRRAAAFCAEYDERLEAVAIRYAVETWMIEGSVVGSLGDPAAGVEWELGSKVVLNGGRKLGVSVMGVSTIAELEHTLTLWRSVLDGLENGQKVASRAGRWKRAHEWSVYRRKAVQMLAEAVKEELGEWFNYVWDSPPTGFVNQLGKGNG